jgi:hypothetical protein
MERVYEGGTEGVRILESGPTVLDNIPAYKYVLDLSGVATINDISLNIITKTNDYQYDIRFISKPEWYYDYVGIAQKMIYSFQILK